MSRAGRNRVGWAGVAALSMSAAVVLATCSDDKGRTGTLADAAAGSGGGGAGGAGGRDGSATAGESGSAAPRDPMLASAEQALINGRKVFRNDTFGSEGFWGDTLKLHQAIAGSANGGVGPGLTPKMALAAGLKVDAEAIPAALAAQIKAGQVNLDDPATTLALLKINAVVGVAGIFEADNMKLRSVGIQCSLCHSTVDDSFAPGIGKRLDGWPNRDLNVGAVIAMAPDLSAFTNLLQVPEATVKQVLMSWGPGKFDAHLSFDGKAMRPDGKSGAVLIPAAFGLAGVSLSTYTGWGNVTHWNALVSNLEMMGKGNFYDPRLDNAAKFPVAARVRSGRKVVVSGPDMITSRLSDLQLYQLVLAPPPPPAGSFDVMASERGRNVFLGKAKCATCHVPPLFVEPGWPMHTAAEIGIDDFQAKRSPDERYRTAPLRGLHAHSKGGFYHDGRFATLLDVINHYNGHLSLSLTDAEKNDLVEYLKSL